MPDVRDCLAEQSELLNLNGGLSKTGTHTFDPEQTVEGLESSHTPHPSTTRRPPFDIQWRHSCVTGSFAVGAVTGCRMVRLGTRPGTDAEEVCCPKQSNTTGKAGGLRL
jgi:hypothetical protein